MEAEISYRRSHFLVVRYDHATFTRREILGCVEAENRGVAMGSGRGVSVSDERAAILSACRMSAVFNHEQAVLARQIPNIVHLARQTVQMDGDDRPSAFRDARSD